MICRCSSADSQEILDFIGDDYCRCLYLYLDLLQYGFDNPCVSIWRQNNADGSPAAVWLKYYSGMHVYAPHGYADDEEAAALVCSERPALLCGVPEAVRPVMKYMPDGDYEYQEGVVCRYDKPSGEMDKIGMRVAECEEDFIRIGEMLSSDASYGTSYSAKELAGQLQERTRLGLGKSFVVDMDGKIVTHICIAAECDRFSLLSGGITDHAYRHAKLCSKLLYSITERLRADGKESYSFYYNPIAAAMHRKNGFRDCCAWGRLSLRNGR